MDPVNLLKNLPFAVEGKIAEKLNARLGRHPPSFPFLSGDTFRSIADYVMDVDPVSPPPEVTRPGVLFLSSWRIEEFRSHLLEKLQHPLVVITHHGDVDITEKYRDVAEHPRIIRWFAQNARFTHPKIEPLPIGLEDQRLHCAGHVRDFVWLRKRSAIGKPRIVWGFSLGTNPDARFPCYRNLWHNPVADELWWPLNARLYRKAICRYMFVASPPGNGVDCHRTWEAMYLRVVPILLEEYPFTHFAEKGLPLFLIKDWSELRSLELKRLEGFYANCAARFENPMLFFPYWRERIWIALQSA